MTLFGLDRCAQMVEQETAQALSALKNGGFYETGFIEDLSQSLVGRMK